MPDIQPFRAFVYGAKHQKNIQSLVCPPYDVISPEGRAALVKRPRQFCPRRTARGDAATRYGDAARLWSEWVEQGVLERDERPCLYGYEARFRSQVDGRLLKRRGFFASLKTAPWGRGVFPHEKTLPTHKVDRLNLFKAARVQTSPIQLLAQDRSGPSRGR
ncbi:MAG: DUF1015 family protein [Elusimicrobia bacterium]|nr:DUF1015 family protein [Elusimicrobiota bacterium]